MRFEQLECLLAVEETGSFVGAAQKLFLTQQAVSMSMKQLEQMTVFIHALPCTKAD